MIQKFQSHHNQSCNGQYQNNMDFKEDRLVFCSQQKTLCPNDDTQFEAKDDEIALDFVTTESLEMFRPPGIVLCKSRHDAVDVCPSPTSRRSPISNPQNSNPRRHRSNRATNSPKCLPGWVGGKEKDKHLQKHKL